MADLVICPCQNCSGQIEFDPANLSDDNNTIVCPHCSLETVLFVPPPVKSQRETSFSAEPPPPVNFGKKAAAGIIVGVVLLLTGNGMTKDVLLPEEFRIVTSLITAMCGLAVFIWGCMNLARWKGFSEWFGFFGYLMLLGLIILACFPNRRKRAIERQNSRSAVNAGAGLEEIGISLSNIVVVLAPLGLFVTFLGINLVRIHSTVNAANWTQVGSPETGFQAVLPGKPEMLQKSGAIPQGNLEMTKYTVLLKGRHELYLIIAWHEISRRPDLTEQLLELARTDIISSSHAQLQSEEPITLGSIPGKELRLAPSEGAIKARVYATKNMAYEVAVLSSMARMSSADVEKFFDSFKLTADSGETPTAPENKDNIDPGAAAKIDPAPAPVASIATAQRQSSGCVTPPSGLAYWWRGEGDTRDAVGGNNGTPQGRITYTTGEVGKAFNLDGSSGYISTSTRISNPQTFSLSLWFRTGATQGGVLISFDSSQASELVRGRLYDRNIYMDNAGALHFGVWNGNPDQIDTRTGYNDNKWHQVVGSLSADTGLSFYVDGTLAGNNPAVTRAVETYDGYWRIGEGKLDNWPNPPASLYFKGQIDEVAIFDTALSAIDVAAIYGAGRNGMCRP